ncbi:AraC-like DNA-binding protein [Streptacidiphilus sp. MAP12-16]|uniref:helix-turn-helix domain-containing protein n=1 Tax=Streptacidiphilus sp. MAP12-16 TaxID=3156300 RepID=UPI003519C511
MYQERAALVVPGAVLWARERTRAAEVVRVLPDGCMDLIWTEGGLLVAGPDTAAQLVRGRAGDRHVGLRFAPGTATDVLGVPAHELRDRRVPLGELWPERTARLLAERVGEAVESGGRGRGAALEAVAVARLREAPPPPDRVREAVVGGLRRGCRIADLAGEVGLSERQLRRRCLDAFGYGPKTLARVLRLERALAAARGGLPFALVAALAGYADQAHLAREVRALAGVPLGELLLESPGASGAVPGGQPGAVPGAQPAQAGSGAKRSTALPSGSWTMA